MLINDEKQQIFFYVFLKQASTSGVNIEGLYNYITNKMVTKYCISIMGKNAKSYNNMSYHEN